MLIGTGTEDGIGMMTDVGAEVGLDPGPGHPGPDLGAETEEVEIIITTRKRGQHMLMIRIERKYQRSEAAGEITPAIRVYILNRRKKHQNEKVSRQLVQKAQFE